jgi:ribose transport system permease protein
MTKTSEMLRPERRPSTVQRFASRFIADYGMIFVLLLLCALFSALTYSEQHPAGAAGAARLARRIVREAGADAQVLIATRASQEDQAFALRLREDLLAAGLTAVASVQGGPREARQALADAAAARRKLDVIACNQASAEWLLFASLANDFPQLGAPRVMQPESYYWPNFLKTDNLLNIANQIAVIAIVAIGMTMVIITAGIDLSVGSLIALSAVAATLLVREVAGGTAASTLGMALSCLGGMLVCGLVGGFSGVMVTWFAIPPFIVTLAMMLVASGLAYILSQGQSVYQVPDSIVWLGRGADLLGVPNAVVLMLVLYAVAHIVMSRTVLGRYLYAVGGNPEAARLSGVPVKRVVLFAYALSGLLAGLGGVVMASQLKSGSPTYGQMYELYVIAAVVVGGTSLSGGEGKVLGTLIGAFTIAVIQNGMNLMNVESYTQKVVLGMVILLAVLSDKLKHSSWLRFSRRAA